MGDGQGHPPAGAQACLSPVDLWTCLYTHTRSCPLWAQPSSPRWAATGEPCIHVSGTWPTQWPFSDTNSHSLTLTGQPWERQSRAWGPVPPQGSAVTTGVCWPSRPWQQGEGPRAGQWRPGDEAREEGTSATAQMPPREPPPITRSTSQEQRKRRELPVLPRSLGVPTPFLAESTEAELPSPQALLSGRKNNNNGF